MGTGYHRFDDRMDTSWITRYYPRFFSMGIANSLIFVGICEIARAIHVFNGQPVKSTLYYIGIALLALMMIAVIYSVNILSTRVIITSLIVTVLASYTAWILISPTSALHSSTRMITSFGFWIQAGIFLARAIHTFANPSKTNSLLSNNESQTIIFSILSIAMILTNYSFLLMCNEHFNNELKTQAVTDWLTGIFNRRAFQELALHEVARVRRNHHPLTMLLLDLDHFKEINDTYGHEAGDSVLKMVATVLTQNVRLQDIVGRFGGDEFAVLLPETNQDMADTIRTRLEQEIQQATTTYQGKDIGVASSIGIGILNPDNPDYDDMVRRADIALYKVKGKRREAS